MRNEKLDHVNKVLTLGEKLDTKQNKVLTHEEQKKID